MKGENDSRLKKELARLQHAYGLEYEMVRAAAAFEHAALRPLFILNGGALVVYLALYGTLASKGIEFSLGKYAIFLWVAGLLLATAAAFFGALSQNAFRGYRGWQVVRSESELGLHNKSVSEADKEIGKLEAVGNCHRKVAVGLGALSVVLFAVGFWPAFSSIK